MDGKLGKRLSSTADWRASRFSEGPLIRLSSPGRFFAAAQLKALLAYMVINYDIKLEGNARPKNFFFSMNMLPSQSGSVLIKKCKSKLDQ